MKFGNLIGSSRGELRAAPLLIGALLSAGVLVNGGKAWAGWFQLPSELSSDGKMQVHKDGIPNQVPPYDHMKL
jgi:hypothetical protein